MFRGLVNTHQYFDVARACHGDCFDNNGALPSTACLFSQLTSLRRQRSLYFCKDACASIFRERGRDVVLLPRGGRLRPPARSARNSRRRVSAPIRFHNFRVLTLATGCNEDMLARLESPHFIARPLFASRMLMCQWGLPPVLVGGLAVVLRLSGFKAGESVGRTRVAWRLRRNVSTSTPLVVFSSPNVANRV